MLGSRFEKEVKSGTGVESEDGPGKMDESGVDGGVNPGDESELEDCPDGNSDEREVGGRVNTEEDSELEDGPDTLAERDPDGRGSAAEFMVSVDESVKTELRVALVDVNNSKVPDREEGTGEVAEEEPTRRSSTSAEDSPDTHVAADVVFVAATLISTGFVNMIGSDSGREDNNSPSVFSSCKSGTTLVSIFSLVSYDCLSIAGRLPRPLL